MQLQADTALEAEHLFEDKRVPILRSRSFVAFFIHLEGVVTKDCLF